MLRVVGHEAVDDEGAERSLLDEIARDGTRRMLLAALETEVAAIWKLMPATATPSVMPWSFATAPASPPRASRG
jgi:hypothetical protein